MRCMLATLVSSSWIVEGIWKDVQYNIVCLIFTVAEGNKVVVKKPPSHQQSVKLHN